MSQKSKQKASARQVKQARQAKRVINGIFIGLIILMIICLAVYSIIMG